MVMQKELQEFLDLSSKIDLTEKKIKLAKARLGDLEQNIIKSINAGDIQEKGSLWGRVKEKIKKVSVSWKDVVEKLKGKEFVERTLYNARKEVEHKVDKEYELEVVPHNLWQ